MMNVAEFLLYAGGVAAVSDRVGLWRALVWPYFAGQAVARWAFPEAK